MKNQPLTFDRLRKQNKKRCEIYFHPIKDWSEAEWACALAGETGELCNFIKKRTRYLKSKPTTLVKVNKQSFNELRNEAKKEIGDVLCYLDLLATSMDLRLEDCVRDKFNEVSGRVKSKIRL